MDARVKPAHNALNKPAKLVFFARADPVKQKKGNTNMAQHRLGIIMNGVTGRMGMNQHLIRSILAIRAQGGAGLRNGDRVMPDPILVGRNEGKLAELAKTHGITRWTTNLNAATKKRQDTW